MHKYSVVLASILLITPPFTQLNTPYPATAYLKGFLNTKGIGSFQADLGIEVTLQLFSSQGLKQIFSKPLRVNEYDENIQRIYTLRNAYLQTIDDVILFLQGKNPTLAHFIARRNFLPEASRFAQLDDLEWAFGTMGVEDKAKHLATMYLEDISDYIKACIDPHFGFSRYAERLGRSANSFDALHDALQQPLSMVDTILIELLEQYLQQVQPQLVALSVPFPGNLFASLRCGQYIKSKYPNIKVAMGGGFANTELRSLKDVRVFEYYDFITLDDGEAPIENLYLYLNNHIAANELKRTYLLQEGEVAYINNASCKDYKQAEVGTPDYSDFKLDSYLQAIEIMNPMHSLWSNGRWNKLTMAHGCYWGKCTFCDVSLDYIRLYEPVAAKTIVDRMEQLVAQTGNNGFHFVDEAAPPALMREVALEIIRRRLVVSWWTNIRFEKSFTRDLCLLLRTSGCIGVSGGLEVASDRLLALIQKGITVAQVAQVNRYFTEAGIMVHAYLMYGFPTQTAQETIDSLEMVRQMFQAGVLQSAFWHQFAMTAHSPVGLAPEKFGVHKAADIAITFADNDVQHIDPSGADHDSFGYGLKKSLLNYMHGIGFDQPLHTWFDGLKVPKTTVTPTYIQDCLLTDAVPVFKPTAKVVFIGNMPTATIFTKSKKGNTWEMMELQFHTMREVVQIQLTKQEGEWLITQLPQWSIYASEQLTTLQQVKESYEVFGLYDFELFWDKKPMSTLHRVGVLRL